MESFTTLVRQAQGGDLRAYGQLVERFQQMACGYAYSVIGHFDLAEDAAQEAFLEAYRTLSTLREPAAFGSWLRRIVFKHCDRLTRSVRPAVALEPDMAEEPASGGPGPGQVAEERELQARVLSAITSLPQHQRIVATLFHMGRSPKDIAAFLDVPAGTVRRRLHEARELLKERMMTMVEDTRGSFPLQPRFANIVVQTEFVARRVRPLAERMAGLTDEPMREMGDELRKRAESPEAREAVTAEGLALVCESFRRNLGIVPYDVQLAASLSMQQGCVAQVNSGEGKSITCVLAAFLGVIEGRRVHVVTVNDYLARRDAEMAGQALGPLGVSVSFLSAKMPVTAPAEERRQAYRAQVLYATAAELGFDAMRDALAGETGTRRQGPLDCSIIDEADSILIDEMLTPLIISDRAPRPAELYAQADAIARDLLAQNPPGPDELFTLRSENREVILTSAGLAAVQQRAGTGPARLSADDLWPQLVRQALRAHVYYRRDQDYVVQDGRCVIVDIGTGRPLTGREWSEGLHQAVQAKEQLPITPEWREKCRLWQGEFFKRYRKLAGITGTAAEATEEFKEAYGLDVAIVPTRRAMNRTDYDDRVFRDAAGKHAAIVEEVRHYSRELGGPVLVGTVTIDEAQRVSEVLDQAGLEHRVLDARPGNAARETDVIAVAGEHGAITVATMMAGRGTDIVVKGAGGLHVVGASRYRSRRMDNQFRNRAGRDGQPGSSRFFVSLEDELLVNEPAARRELGLDRQPVVEGPAVNRLIERYQAEAAKRDAHVRKVVSIAREA